jgi:hypothetical protein
LLENIGSFRTSHRYPTVVGGRSQEITFYVSEVKKTEKCFTISGKLESLLENIGSFRTSHRYPTVVAVGARR